MDDGRAQCVSVPRPRASASSSQRFLQPIDLNRRRCSCRFTSVHTQLDAEEWEDKDSQTGIRRPEESWKSLRGSAKFLRT